MHRSLTATLFAVATLALAACDIGSVTNTGDPPPSTGPAVPAAPPIPALNRASMDNAFDYFAESEGRRAYYFTTPSGRWDCAILPRSKAGCQRSNGGEAPLGITGAPTEVADAEGEAQTPNAIEVGREGDARFARLDRPEFELIPGPAKVLDFDRTLVVAGFRCNVQEQSGVSCLNEWTGKGFTFSQQEWAPTYVEVPVERQS